jgi:PAS domain S-box-containing protein
MTKLRISTRLWLMVGLSFTLFFVAIGIGLHSLKTGSNALQTVYKDHALAMEYLSELAATLRENRAEVYRIFQHSSANPARTLHDHSIDTHLDAIEERITKGDAFWKDYLATHLDPEEVLLATEVTQKRSTWLTYLKAAIDAVKVGDFSNKTIVRFSDEGNDAFQVAMKTLAKLRDYQVTAAEQEYLAAEVRYQHSLIKFALLAIFGGLGLMGSAYFALRRIIGGLREVGTAAREISAGNFATPLLASGAEGSDEINELMTHMGAMRDSLVDIVGSLRTSETRSRAILRTMRDGVVTIDTQGTILSVNDRIGEMFGYNEDELVGHNVSLLMPEPDRSAHDGHLQSYQATRRGATIGRRVEVVGQRKNSSLIPIDLYVNEMVDDEGSTFIGVIRDITEQKQAQQELEAALIAAKAAAEARSRFLANMSHEIRTPINAVLGFAYICQTLELPARGRDHIDKIRSAAESLLGVVNDILDFSKIEAGKLETESIPFSLGEVLDRTASLFRLKAHEKKLELVIGAMPEVPDRLMGDALRLGQVLANLLSNAFKFTERGEIGLIVEQVAATADAVTLRFEVRDTGLGMTAEQLAGLFTPFAQADNSTTRKFGGTGLGLAISKQLVEHMGGEIGVESESGVGSCFKFTACFGIDKGEAAPIPSQSPLTGKRVLVVDDNAVMRSLLVQMGKVFGCHMETVDSGETALARLQAGKRVDLILMDWQLTGLDGLATAHRIRMAGGLAPIILITGGEVEMARAQMHTEDIQAFLTKPVSRATLYRTMINALDGKTTAPTPSAGRHVTPLLPGVSILLVDDNDFNRQVGRELVELTGAAVDTAEDGAQAVSAVYGGSYDLVLMDLQMPVMDGYTAARIIRESRPDLPILALTAHAMIEEKERVLAAGMNDIVTKPILPHILYAMLVRWLPGPRPERESMPADPPPLSATMPHVAAEVFDHAAALTRVNGDSKMLGRYLRMFRERNTDIVTHTGEAMAAHDLTTARRLAHTLKGGAGTVGLIELQNQAARLEATLAEALLGRDQPTHRKEDFAALTAAWSRALEALEALFETPVSEREKP